MPRPQKTKDGFVEQLELKKTEMEKLKSSMEQLYSSLCSIEDKDLSGEQQKAVNDSMQAADALGNSLTGTVKPMKVSLETRAINIMVMNCNLKHATRQPNP